MAPDNMGSTAPEYVARAIPAIEDLSDKAAMQRALSSSRPAFIRFDSRGCTGCANLDRTYAALPLTIPGATAWRVDCGSVAHSLCEAPAVAERVPPGGLAFAHARQGTFEWYEGRRVASDLWSWAERVAGIADDGRAMHRAFDRIYLLDQWVANGGPGSGTGSAPEVNAEYMTFLEGLIRERGVPERGMSAEVNGHIATLRTGNVDARNKAVVAPWSLVQKDDNNKALGAHAILGYLVSMVRMRKPGSPHQPPSALSRWHVWAPAGVAWRAVVPAQFHPHAHTVRCASFATRSGLCSSCWCCPREARARATRAGRSSTATTPT